jgi:general stress protein 26
MVDTQQGFRAVLGHFGTAMLCTRQPDGALRGRPMAIARSEENGDVWFVTKLDTGKVEELLRDPHVAVTMQSKTHYLSLSGRAEIVGDPAKLDELWQASWRAWFPAGKDEAGLALLHVRANEAEYWAATGALRYAFAHANAQHGHVLL